MSALPRPSSDLASPRPGPAGLAVALAASLTVGLAFWAGARDAAHGFFPAPLDDVFIHYDFARSLATGHGLSWVPGNGYSSGETAPLYALVLAVGWAVGFRGPWLGAWGALVALASMTWLVLATRRLLLPCRPWVAACAPLLVLACPLVDWALVSGMEVALHAAVLGSALVALDRATSDLSRRKGRTRESWQVRLGLLGGALVLLRPESVVLTPLFATFAARAVGRRSAVAVALRVGLPALLVVLAMAATNQLLTGDPRAAGAQLKLLSSNPYLGETDRARAYVEILVTFAVRVIGGELASVRALAWVLPVLGAGALAARPRRPVVATCLLGALGFVLLVSWNGNAPFHNFRYYAPALVLVLVAGALGVGAIARAKHGRHASAALLALGLAACGARLPAQLDYFRRCVANVRDQQVEVGLRIAAMTPPSARVLVGDAGAIPYVSGRGAVDALGLGGYRGLPFARAAVQGEASVVELLQRVPARERPTHLALYPNWFAATTSRFGREIARVTIEDNVVCGGPTKVIYEADWRALDGGEDPPGARVVDALDVADVVSEAEHGFVSPAPLGGWTVLDLLADDQGALRFDGGRILPEGTRASFRVRASAPGRVGVVVRTDAGAGEARLVTSRGEVTFTLDPPREGAWRLGRAELESLAGDDVVAVVAARGVLRLHHVWIVASPTTR